MLVSHLRTLVGSILLLLAVHVHSASGAVWINEFHYDNDGTDAGEFIELAYTTDPTGYSIVLYNGADGLTYGTLSMPDKSSPSGVEFYVFTDGPNFIQNGSPDGDGIALINADDVVVEFISYEGTFKALDGPAMGTTSTNIGVREDGNTPVGSSLQRIGEGCEAGKFGWNGNGPAPESPGDVNAQQTFTCGGGEFTAWINEIHYENVGADVGEFAEIAYTTGLDITGYTIVLYNGSPTSLGTQYDKKSVTAGTTSSGGITFTSVSIDGFQNGADAIALVATTGNVVQFLSYEGSFSATEGPADGMESDDIGVSEGSSTEVGQSLQLTGQGCKAADFAWGGPIGETPGEINADQIIDCTVGVIDDPHFKTWAGTFYDFMGGCDLVLIHAPQYFIDDPDHRVGLTIHIRTTVRHKFSFIESAVVQIGNEEALEVGSFGQYSLDGISNAQDMTFAGMPVNHTTPSKHIQLFEISLNDATVEAIVLRVFKDWVSVKLVSPHPDKFRGSGGMMGDPKSGSLFGRDGATVFSTSDTSAFAGEWQVRGDSEEPNLFKTKREPQFPMACAMPKSDDAAVSRGRRLGEMISRAAAEEACTGWNANKKLCVHDVMATGDLDLAAAGAF